MAKEIITHVWCDPCLGEEKHTPSHEVLVGFDRKWMTLDLCEDHEQALVKPLRALLEEFGAKVEVPGPKQVAKGADRVMAISNKEKGPQAEQTLLQYEMTGVRKGRQPSGDRGACCLWCPMTYSSNASSGLNRHLATAHGWDGLVEALGNQCPICGKVMAQVGGHVTRAHADYGFDHVTQAFLWARDNGDPHGVYAERVAQEGPHDKQELFERYRRAEAKWDKTAKEKKQA